MFWQVVFTVTYTVHCVIVWARGESCVFKQRWGLINLLLTFLTCESGVETAFLSATLCFLLFLRQFGPKIGEPTNRCWVWASPVSQIYFQLNKIWLLEITKQLLYLQNPAEGETAATLHWLLPTLRDVKHCPFIVLNTPFSQTVWIHPLWRQRLHSSGDDCISVAASPTHGAPVFIYTPSL